VTNLPQFASMARGVGDLDGNGLGDVAVAFPNAAGGSFSVFFGRNGTLDMAAPFTVSSSSLNGFGAVVAPAGDVNGDGIDDLVVGSPNADNIDFYCGVGFSGQVNVYFGALATGPIASNVWVVPGCLQTGNDTQFGASVGAAGDVNGDGVDDLVIGAPSARRSQFPQNQAGRVFVLHGSTSGLPMDPVRPALGALIGATVIDAPTDFSSFGAAAIGAGDVNGDGYADLAVGSPDEDFSGTDRGFIRVYAGSSTGVQPSMLLYQGVGDTFEHLGARVFPAGDVNGDARADLLAGGPLRMYLIPSIGSVPGYLGTVIQATTGTGLSFCTAGDVNGDGLSDVVVGDPTVANPEGSEGRIQVFAGKGDGPSYNSNWNLKTSLTLGLLGWSVAPAGDVNGDGFDDVLTGAPRLPNIAAPGEENNGGVFLNYGGLNGLTPGFSDWGFVGAQEDQLGTTVAAAGDINGDGFGDIMAGAIQPGIGWGKVLIWYGRNGGLLPGAAPDVTLPGPGVFDGQFGAAITSGDFNGDGYSDIAVSTPNYSDGFAFTRGRVDVYVGGPGGLNTTSAFLRLGGDAFERLGESLAGDLDMNGDGYNDLAIGVPAAHDAGPIESGRVELFVGKPGSPPLDVGTGRHHFVASDRFGHHVASAGDVNGDGFGDLIVGMPWHNDNEGLVEVWTGQPSPPIGNLISFTPMWSQVGFEPGTLFGSAVSTAGDVNGDGLSDVLIGSESEIAGGMDGAGFARVYLGPLPTAAAPAWAAGGTIDLGHFGHSASIAGDVNNDGWGDLIIGSPMNSENALYNGRADLFFGAGAIGRLNDVFFLRNDGRHVQLRGLTDNSSVRAFQAVATAAGRTKIRMQWDLQGPVAFPPVPVAGIEATFTPTGAPGSLGSWGILLPTINGLLTGMPYSWRVRTLSRSIYFPSTKWVSPGRNGVREWDLRSPGTWVGVEDERPLSAELALAAPWPNPTTGRSRVTFDLPRAGKATLEVLDLQGRRVRSLLDGMQVAGRHQADWDGSDQSGRAVGPGVYFYRLRSEQLTKSQRVAVIR
jgi:hypothetical protein